MHQASSFPNPMHEPSVHRAWESLVRGEDHHSSALRPLIDHSWQRCLAAQVDPSRDGALEIISSDTLLLLHEQQHDIVQASAPAMGQARDYLAETGSIMILADANGTILASEGDIATQDAAHRIHLTPGARWTETHCGTNAIGTALAVGEPVQIHSYEHFCAGIKHWTCAAAVVRHPMDGDILGAVDVSGLASTFNRHSLALAVATAKRIENRLAMAEMERRYRLLDASLTRWSHAASHGAVLFDRRGVPIKASDSISAAILAAGGPADWLQHLRKLSPLAHWRQGNPVPEGLPAWLEASWLHPVMAQGQWLGTLLLLPTHSVAVPLPTASPRRVQSAQTQPSDPFEHVLHQHPTMQAAVHRARQLAPAPTAVLLQGETGTGKEVFARALHCTRSGQFIALNCGGLARDLLASELFGYAEGAFTGARKGGMPGKLEAAEGGTLFLDEIGEMPLDMQPMLLRALEQGEVCRLGENTPRKLRFRLVAATHRPLRQEVDAGRFRMDLYYRIAVASLHIPPLRERGDDVLLLAQHYLQHFRQQAGHRVSGEALPPAVVERLRHYPWPGNVRELRNAMESAVLLSAGGPLTLECLPPELLSGTDHTPQANPPAPESTATSCTMQQAEAQAIRAAIEATGGNLTQAARRLGIAKSTLYTKLHRHGLRRP